MNNRIVYFVHTFIFISVFLFLSVISITSAFAQTVQGNQTVISVPVSTWGSTVQALLKLPDDYSSTTKTYPLLVFLHGAGEAGTPLSKIYGSSSAGGPAYYIAQGTFPTSFTNPATGQQEKFIVLSPQASSWSTSTEQLEIIVKDMVAKYRVDTNRIYLTGLSAGGEGIYNYTVKNFNVPTYKPAAIVPMSAAISRPTNVEVNATLADSVHVWGFGSESDIHGSMTHLYVTGSYSGNTGPTPPGLGSFGRFTSYAGGHCCWGTYYNPTYKEIVGGISMNIYEWMLQFSRGASTPPPSDTTAPSVPTNLSGSAISQTQINLSWTASTDAVGVSGYKIYRGGTQIGTSASASYSATGLTAATAYSFTVASYDAAGNTSAQTTSISVTTQSSAPANVLPTANAGLDQAITLPTATVTLTGSGTDSDGTISSYAWTKISGGAATIVSPTSATTSISGLVQGTYTFWLTVTDNSGGTNADSVTVTVNAQVSPPTGGTKTYLVDFGGNQVTTTSGWNTVTSPAVGTTLALKDSTNTASSASLQITDAFNSENIVGTTSSTLYPATATGDSFFVGTVGGVTDDTATVTFSGLSTTSTYSFVLYASRVAGDGGNRTALYTIGSQSVSLNATDNINTTVTISGVTTTTGSIALTVTHPTSAYGYIGVLQINEFSSGSTPTNQSPSVSLTSPANGTSSAAPANFTLSASASDSDGTVSSVAFYNGATLLNTDTTSPYSYAWSSVAAGTYSITAKATDNSGATTTSSAVSVTVTSTGNASPTSNAGLNQTITLPTASVTLTGSGTDSDGTIASYAWTKVSTLAGTISSPSSASTLISGLVAGTHTFRLTVTDNSGATATDDVVVVVNAATPSGPGTVHIIGTGSGSIIMNSIPGLACGDTIAINAGTYDGITFRDIQGCAGNPVTIRNNGGQVVMNLWGLELHNMQHIVVKAETPGTYGFKTIAPYRAGVSITESSKDIDVSGTQVSAPAGYGVTVKTDPKCDVLDHVYPLVIDDIRIHDNLIEGTAYEGMYIGYMSAGDVSVTCGTVTTVVKAERTSRVSVYNNIFNKTGNEAIKLRLCENGCDIYNNIIDDYGWLRTDDTAWCFGIQVGPPTYGKIYGNVIKHGYCSAIDIRTNETQHLFEVYNNTTQYAGTLSDGRPGAWWAGGVLFNIMAANQQFSITNNISSNHLGADFETTNYSNLPYIGNVCNNGLTEKWTNGTLKPTCTGSVTPTNQIPTSNAGTDKTITLPTASVTLTGSGTDSDGTIASYAWTKVSTLAGTISSPSSASTLISGLVAGTHTFRLTVTDNSGATATDDVVVVVNAPGFTLSAGVDQTITLPTSSVIITANVSGGATPASYLWTKTTGGTATIVSPSSASTNIFGFTQGVYDFQVAVTDTLGRVLADTVRITVLPAINVSPTSNAGTDKTITLPTASVTLTGSGTDSDGTIASYAWTKVSTLAGTISSPSSASTLISGLVAGTHTFRLTVTDNSGATATDDVVVIVNGATVTNTPPTVSVGSAQTITLPNSSVSLVATATDSDPMTYSWTKFSGGTTAVISSPNSLSTQVIGLVEGVYTFRFTATDNKGASASGDVLVTVNSITASNHAPVVSAGADISTTAKTVQLSGSATDSDGDLLTYSWSQVFGAGVASIVSGTKLATTINNLNIGTYTFSLSATDTKGATATDTINVIVTAVTPSGGGGGGGGGGGSSNGGGVKSPITTGSTATTQTSFPNPEPTTTTTTTTTTTSSTATVNVKKLNVRTEPSTGTIINTVPRNTTVTILETNGGWTKVSLPDGTTGWVYGSYITPVKTSTSTNTSTSTGATAKVVTTKLNVRSSPTSGAIITSVPRNTTLTVLNKSGSWANVSLSDGTTGWVYASYIKTVSTITNPTPTTVSVGTKVSVTAKLLNVRSSPSKGSVVGTVTQGINGTVVSGNLSTSTWIRVSFDNGVTGYVSKSYIQTQ